MLQSLHVKNLALIDEVEIEFQPGLNILTGETGAGKSIVIGSVNLALGARYHADILRQGASSALVELIFIIESKEQAEKLETLGIIPEDGLVVVSRKFTSGRSISRVNGEMISLGRLKEAAEILIDLHGQHEHQSLLYKKNHLMILDAYAKDEIAPIKEEVKAAYESYLKCRRKLESESIDETARKREISLLEFEISEIREASLIAGEDDELELEYQKAVNSKKLSEGVSEAYGYTSDRPGQNASDALSRAIHSLQQISGYDNTVNELSTQLSEVDGLLNDFNRELSEYGKSLEFSDEDFRKIENRLNVINHLKSKYGDSVAKVLLYLESREEKLAQLNQYDTYQVNLKNALKAAEEELIQHASSLTKIRRKKAKVLASVIKQSLLELNFLEVKFEVSINSLKEYSADGCDEVEFMVSMNPGEQVKPLGNIASGGELSRIMLAIKTVLAEKDAIETLIFDEIDVGISGRTAQKVSEKMALLARGHQVICITHLAQIAAMADAHYLIEKNVSQNATKTDIYLLDEEQAVNELARILSGVEMTEAVRENAAEMKKLAKSKSSK